MHVLRVSAALAVVVLAAPRARAAEACTLPSAGDWHEYQSKHFTLVTDGGGVRATVAVQQLEELHALVVQALVGEQVEIPGRVRVIAFSDPSRFESLTGKWYVSGLATVSNLGELTIVYATEGLKAVPETVAHELAHHVSWYLFPRQPRWFSEGLAEFIQTVATERLDESSATGTHVNRGTRGSGGRWAGLAPREMLLALHSAAPLPSKELLEWRGAIDEANPARFHMSSWLLYHWLWNDRPKQFTSFQQRLSAGELPDAAWRAEFPEWDPARPATLGTLDEALERYRRAG